MNVIVIERYIYTSIYIYYNIYIHVCNILLVFLQYSMCSLMVSILDSPAVDPRFRIPARARHF